MKPLTLFCLFVVLIIIILLFFYLTPKAEGQDNYHLLTKFNKYTPLCRPDSLANKLQLLEVSSFGDSIQTVCDSIPIDTTSWLFYYPKGKDIYYFGLRAVSHLFSGFLIAPFIPSQPQPAIDTIPPATPVGPMTFTELPSTKPFSICFFLKFSGPKNDPTFTFSITGDSSKCLTILILYLKNGKFEHYFSDNQKIEVNSKRLQMIQPLTFIQGELEYNDPDPEFYVLFIHLRTEYTVLLLKSSPNEYSFKKYL